MREEFSPSWGFSLGVPLKFIGLCARLSFSSRCVPPWQMAFQERVLKKPCTYQHCGKAWEECVARHITASCICVEKHSWRQFLFLAAI